MAVCTFQTFHGGGELVGLGEAGAGPHTAQKSVILDGRRFFVGAFGDLCALSVAGAGCSRHAPGGLPHVWIMTEASRRLSHGESYLGGTRHFREDEDRGAP